jgi:replicative DNA helicase
VDLLLAKNRSGPCGRIPLVFNRPVTTFRELELSAVCQP